MTYEEALKHIEISLMLCESMNVFSDNADFWKTAKKAVEKQIPLKVKNREFESASCPICGTTVLMLANELEYEKYCPQCGQALDWSDE